MSPSAARRSSQRRVALVALFLLGGCSPSYEDLPESSLSPFLGVGTEHRQVGGATREVGQLSVEFVHYVDASGQRVDLFTSLAFADPGFYADLRERVAQVETVFVHDRAPDHVRAKPHLLRYFDAEARVEAEYLGLATEQDELSGLFAAHPNLAVRDPKLASVTEAELWSTFQSAAPLTMRFPKFPPGDPNAAPELDAAKLLGAETPKASSGDWQTENADELRRRRLASAMAVREMSNSLARDRAYFAADEARMEVMVGDALARGVDHVAIVARAPWMYGFEQVLEQRLGFRRRSAEWVTAWKIE
ncbi:MAG: hypothetical protein KDB80_00715 [Planctomycetes bacterium]|nr:hypothetical protein [Planctomycetota bacterium]